MTPTPSSPAATAARRAAEEIARYWTKEVEKISGRPTEPDMFEDIVRDHMTILAKHLPAHGDGTGGGELLAALHKCYAATGEDAGDIDDFRALVDREAHSVEAVQAMRRELDAATARADALAADKRRLDWLESGGPDNRVERSYKAWLSGGRKFRAAIDAAMGDA